MDEYEGVGAMYEYFCTTFSIHWRALVTEEELNNHVHETTQTVAINYPLSLDT